jgi:hypothetical protein
VFALAQDKGIGKLHSIGEISTRSFASATGPHAEGIAILHEDMAGMLEHGKRAGSTIWFGVAGRSCKLVRE